MGEAARDNKHLVPDASWHYPPDLLSLLVDAIRLLCRSKPDVLTFFRGAGVPVSMLADWEDQLRANRDAVKKHAIARSVLCALNEHGDPMIRQRREVIKRVVEFEDFSACWESDRLPAMGLVSRVREVVDVKDSFVRLRQEHERERRERQTERDALRREAEARRGERDQIKRDFFALFAMTDAAKRGKALEFVLNRLFANYGIAIRDAFTVTGIEGEGVVEQLDGAVELDGNVYLVEMKWWDKPLGRGEVSPHLVRVFSRAEARGIIISARGYTDPGITTCREALQNRVCILVELQELVKLLEQDADLRDLLRRKVQAAIADKNPLVY